jgi:hypothetical protein
MTLTRLWAGMRTRDENGAGIDDERLVLIINADGREGYLLKAGQLEYDCRYSKMHGMPVTGGRGFRGLKPWWYNGVPA